jgi:hypothetical protein
MLVRGAYSLYAYRSQRCTNSNLLCTVSTQLVKCGEFKVPYNVLGTYDHLATLPLVEEM